MRRSSPLPILVILLMLAGIVGEPNDLYAQRKGKKPAKREQTTSRAKPKGKSGSKAKSASRGKSEPKSKPTSSRASQSRRSTPQRATTSSSRSQRQRGEAAANRRQQAPEDQPVSPPREPVVDLAQRTISSPQNELVRMVPVAGIAPLPAASLQSITRLDRESSRIPLRPYPSLVERSERTYPAYAEARAGLYGTVGLTAGYSGSSWPFDYAARLDVGSTNGWVTDGDESRFEFSGDAGYVIGDNYGIFSGGHMGGEFGYAGRSWRLHPIDSAPERSLTQWRVALTGDNSYYDNAIALRGGYRGLTFDDAQQGSVNENALEGSASFETRWLGFHAEAAGEMSLLTMSGHAMPFGSLQGALAWRTDGFAISAGARFTAGENSDSSAPARLRPIGRLAITPTRGLSLVAALDGGLHQTTLAEMLTLNPWSAVAPGVEVRHEDASIAYRAELRIDPSSSFGLHVHGAMRSFDTYLYFDRPTASRFAPRYGEATLTQLGGDMTVASSGSFLLTTRLEWTQGELDTAALPYVPQWTGEAMYTQLLSSIPLSITGSARYIGVRPDGAGNDMDPALILSLEGRYRLTSLFELTAQLTNLLDRRYEVWTGYPERGFYAGLGVAVRY